MDKPEPIGWIYEDDEGRITFSQMPQNPPFWEPVYRAFQLNIEPKPSLWRKRSDKRREEIPIKNS